MNYYNVTITPKILMNQKTFYYLGEWGNKKNYPFGLKNDIQQMLGCRRGKKPTNNLNGQRKSMLPTIWEKRIFKKCK